MIALLRNERGAGAVEAVLLDENEECMAHSISLCEVYYHFAKYVSEQRAREAVEDLEGMGLIVRQDLDRAFWQEAGRHKANLTEVPLADCFVAALAARTSARAMTADHDDFNRISQRGICRVTFVRERRR